MLSKASIIEFQYQRVEILGEVHDTTIEEDRVYCLIRFQCLYSTKTIGREGTRYSGS